MTKVNTATADGIVLDWLVAKAENRLGLTGLDQAFGVIVVGNFLYTRDADGDREWYAPSTDWSQGGPIIDRESIYFNPLPDNGIRAYRFIDGSPRDLMDCWGDGVTRLIAAMRCYVASKLGEEVDVPKELL